MLYTLSTDERKAAIAEGLLLQGGYISVQVLNEFTSVARRKHHLSWAEVDTALTSIRQLCRTVRPLTVETHESGFRLAGRYGLHIYDGVILAAALDCGCEVVLSEDMQHGQRIGSLVVHNPFL